MRDISSSNLQVFSTYGNLIKMSAADMLHKRQECRSFKDLKEFTIGEYGWDECWGLDFDLNAFQAVSSHAVNVH